MKTTDWTYKMQNGKVIITTSNGTSPPYDESHLDAAIETVTRQREFYTTEEDWQRQLRKYRGALKFLQSHKELQDVPQVQETD